MKSFSIEQSDLQLRNSTAKIHYVLRFHRAAQHLVDIELQIFDARPPVELYLPSWTPGSYKIREFITNIGDLTAVDQWGNHLSIDWLSKNRIRIAHFQGDTLLLRYCYFAHERSVRTSFVNRWHAFLMPANFCFAVQGRESELHHLTLELPPEWGHVATALSPIFPDEQQRFGALNYDILIDSPIQISPDPVHHFSAGGVLHQLSILGTTPFSIPWLIEKLQRIVETEAALFGELPYDRYVFMLHFFPDSQGGLEHARCSVSGWDPNSATDPREVQRFLTLLAHEFFHVWNGKRIRPVELGPFDYSQENYSRMLWLAEGLTSYYNDLFLYRSGFASVEDFLTILAQDRIQRLLEHPGHQKMSAAESSFLAWVKLYRSTADSPNRFPSYYLKGSIVFLAFDLWLIIESGGAVSLDTVVKALWQRYRANPAVGISEDEFFTIVEESTRLPVAEQLRRWLYTTELPPLKALFAEIGIELRTQPLQSETLQIGNTSITLPPAKVWTGMTLKEEHNTVIVKTVLDNSPAAAAGIGADDVILAINQQKVQTPSQATAILSQHLNEPVTIAASCDGKLYTTQLIPRSAQQYELHIATDASPTAQQLREHWLQRPIRTPQHTEDTYVVEPSSSK